MAISAPIHHPAATGQLYLMPAPLDFDCDPPSALHDVLPLGTLQVASGIHHWICENAKTTRAFLKRIDAVSPLSLPIQSHHIQELPREVHKKGDFSGPSGAIFDATAWLTPALKGLDIGLVSESGMPGVADPGSSVVRSAHQMGITVVPLVGPTSLLMGLAASGLSGQHFAFVGYLPQDAPTRIQKIKFLEHAALHTRQTQIFIETPYRNQLMMDALLTTLQPQTLLSISQGLTLKTALSYTGTVMDWKKQAKSLSKQLPAVYALGR
jgi:16S rRNA (cytidine1402-2'-O)-methyltransferase